MEEIINILLAGELENLNGFQVEGVIRIPKDILAESISKSIVSRQKKKVLVAPQIKEDDNLLKPHDYKKFLEYVEINEANVFFEGEEVCLRLDIKK